MKTWRTGRHPRFLPRMGHALRGPIRLLAAYISRLLVIFPSLPPAIPNPNQDLTHPRQHPLPRRLRLLHHHLLPRLQRYLFPSPSIPPKSLTTNKSPPLPPPYGTPPLPNISVCYTVVRESIRLQHTQAYRAAACYWREIRFRAFLGARGGGGGGIWSIFIVPL